MTAEQSEDSYQPVRVKFPHTEEVWNQVVVASPCPITSEDDCIDTFVVEYFNSDQWGRERTRLGGLVEYEVLT